MSNKASANIAKALADIAKVLVGIAESQVESNRLVEKGHTQERFKIAMEHLGHANASVRMAAFYEFLYLMKGDGKKYRKNILDILYAYVRNATNNPAYKREVLKREELTRHEIHPSVKPTEEIQGLLDMLFKSKDINYSDIKPDLQRSYLPGADLSRTDLSGVDFSGADLRKANLRRADLSDADLSNAKLSNAQLGGAICTNETRFPEGLTSSIIFLDRDNKKRVQQEFIVWDYGDE